MTRETHLFSFRDTESGRRVIVKGETTLMDWRGDPTGIEVEVNGRFHPLSAFKFECPCCGEEREL